MELLKEIKKELNKHANKKKALFLRRFFKTGPGEYSENDKFLGITVPDQRKTAKKYYKNISFPVIISLLQSDIHEYRLTALLLLILKYNDLNDENSKKQIVDIFIININFINNWDLVDLSASRLLGDFLYNFKKDRNILYDFANTEHLWTQRIAIISTFYFINKNEYIDTLNISKILLKHDHDLIHKAVGWMLREVGKKNFNGELNFLKNNYKKMPRTMLRYAIEKFEDVLREKFLNGLY